MEKSNKTTQPETPAVMNDRLYHLTEEMKHNVVRIKYQPENSHACKTVVGTLIGYHYSFGRPYRYLPRLMFIPYFDMQQRKWLTLRTDTIRFNPETPIKEEEIMKKDTVIIHCSATPDGHPFTAADIDSWHRQQGFECIGYHYVVLLDGTIEEGRPYEATGAHTLNWNHRAVGICYIGGIGKDGNPADTRTPQQRSALLRLLIDLRKKHPELTHIFGHCDLARKACPCFDAAKEYESIFKQP